MKTADTCTSVFHGTGIGIGKVCGPLKFFHKNNPRSTIASHTENEDEETRLKTALDQTRKQIHELQRRANSEAGAKEAEIFEIHAMLLDDEDFTDALQNGLSGGNSAEYAVEHAAEQYADLLKALDDPYLSARAADIRDVAGQILNMLSGQNPNEENHLTNPYILVADDLTPSETVLLDKSQILGFVTFGGTSNSHTSILARAMGIPALVSVGDIRMEYDGETAILDAESGTLTVSPEKEQIAEFERQRAETGKVTAEREQYLRSLTGKPAITRSGHRIIIYANVGGESDVIPSLRNGAEGIGLLRSEFLYLSLDRYPTEEELFTAYQHVVEQMEGKRVVIRTLDIGADKKIDYFDLPHEENPALGFRAVRICLARESLFKTQLRAILRASAFGQVSVMIPMIVSVAEVQRCIALLNECKDELKQAGVGFDADIEIGIMIETPASAVMSEELAAEVDFFSVGTNDLMQYTLAADRQNPLLADLCGQNTEPVMRMICMAADAIHRKGGWIGVCGELAADLRLTQRFADMKIDELSVSPPYLLALRGQVTECE